jgi:hypothetical protein
MNFSIRPIKLFTDFIDIKYEIFPLKLVGYFIFSATLMHNKTQFVRGHKWTFHVSHKYSHTFIEIQYERRSVICISLFQFSNNLNKLDKKDDNFLYLIKWHTLLNLVT